jgi:hypothetical protein
MVRALPVLCSKSRIKFTRACCRLSVWERMGIVIGTCATRIVLLLLLLFGAPSNVAGPVPPVIPLLLSATLPVPTVPTVLPSATDDDMVLSSRSPVSFSFTMSVAKRQVSALAYTCRISEKGAR